jgi:hypothetical protein
MFHWHGDAAQRRGRWGREVRARDTAPAPRRLSKET